MLIQQQNNNASSSVTDLFDQMKPYSGLNQTEGGD